MEHKIYNSAILMVLVLFNIQVANAQTDSLKTIIMQAKQGDATAQNEVGGWYYNGKHVKQDYAEAEKWWRKSANQGNVYAIGNLGLCYQYGRGVEKDSLAALRLYVRSAKDGNKRLIEERMRLGDKAGAFDNVFVALCYQKGTGVKKDINAAKTYYTKAAKQNSVDAQRELGVILMNEKNAKEAAPLFKSAAEHGDLSSTYYYGKLLLDGNSISQDKQQGVIYLLKAAEKGMAQAQLEIGVLYSKGDGVKKDGKQAVKWYWAAAGQNNVNAEWNLAQCCMNGTGTIRNYDEALYWYGEAINGGYRRTFKKMCTEDEAFRNSPFMLYMKGMKTYLIDKNFDEAFNIFKALAKQNIVEGQTMQGVIYANKAYMKYNPKKALKLLTSASSTDATASFYLASLYEAGKGTNKDFDKALKLYEKSAADGYPTALCYLGDIYYEGRGVKQDYTKAVEYYLAAGHQNRLTQNARKRLASCYEDGLGGLTTDKQYASKLMKKEQNNNVVSLLNYYANL